MTGVSERVALVTGGNKGIGLEIARQLGQAGVEVLVGARDEGRGRKAAAALMEDGIRARFLPIDVVDAESISAAARSIEEQYGRLDILMNNAGITDPEDGVPSTSSTKAVRRIFETNLFGAHAVAREMLPLIRKSPAGRIVNMSSSLGSLAMNGDPSSPYYAAQLFGYNASKAALNMLTVQLSEELRGTSVTVNSVSPGFVKSDLNGNTGYLSPEQGAQLPVAMALQGDDAKSGQFLDATGATPW